MFAPRVPGAALGGLDAATRARLATTAAAMGPHARTATGLERSGLQSLGLGPLHAAPGDASLDPEHRRLRVAAREFEAVLVSQMLSVMRAAHLFKDPLEQGAGADIFRSLLDSQLGREMAVRGSLGLSDAIFRELVTGLRKAEPEDPPGEQGQGLAPPGPEGLD